MTRHTAQGTARFHESWRDHTTSARREHIFGAIRPMEDVGTGYEHLGIWEKQPSLLAAVCWGVLILVVVALGVAAVAI